VIDRFVESSVDFGVVVVRRFVRYVEGTDRTRDDGFEELYSIVGLCVMR
jgi:hypothetical protein